MTLSLIGLRASVRRPTGERWDVVITAKRRPAATAFWIHTRTVGFCTNRGGSEQRAVLLYKGARSALPRTAAPSIRAGIALPTGTVRTGPQLALSINDIDTMSNRHRRRLFVVLRVAFD